MPVAFSAVRCQIDGLVSDLVHEIFFRLCAPFDTRFRPGGPTHCALIQSTGAHLDQDDLVTVTDESVQRACCADPTPAGALGAIAGNPSAAMADAPLAMVVNTNLFFVIDGLRSCGPDDRCLALVRPAMYSGRRTACHHCPRPPPVAEVQDVAYT